VATTLNISINATGATAGAQQVNQALGSIPPQAGQVTRAVDAVASSLQRIAQIAAGITLAGLFRGLISDAEGLVKQGISYSATLERSRLGIAALLQGTTQLVDASGKQVSTSAAWTANLKEAGALQEKIAQMSASTLGTQQELLDVFRNVLAFGRGQVATDNDRLQAAQGILNISKLLGLNDALVENQSREIFTLLRAQGQIVLQTIGITVEQARQYKAQGTLIQELNAHLAVYNQLAEGAALTWVGLTTTVSTFSNLTLAANFAGVFSAMKEVLIGARDELDKLRAAGESVPVNVDTQTLRQAGAFAADLWDWLVKLAAKSTVVAIQVVTQATSTAQPGGITSKGVGFAAAKLGTLALSAAISEASDVLTILTAALHATEGAALALMAPFEAVVGQTDTLDLALQKGQQALDEWNGVAGKTGAQLTALTTQWHQLPDSVNLGTVAFEALGGAYVSLEGSQKRLSLSQDESNKAVAAGEKLATEAAKAYVELAVALGKVTGSSEGIQASFQAQLQQIEAQRQQALALAKASNVKDTSEIDRRASDATTLVVLKNEQDKSAAAQLRSEQSIKATQAEFAVEAATAEGRKTLLQGQVALQQANLTLLQQANAPLAAQQAAQDKLLSTQQQLAAAGVSAAQANQAKAQADLNGLLQQQVEITTRLGEAQRLGGDEGAARAAQDQKDLTATNLKIQEATANVAQAGTAVTAAQNQVAAGTLQAQQAAIALTDQFIKQAQVRADAAKSAGDLQQQSDLNAIANQKTVLQADQQRLTAEKELAVASGASAQEIFAITQRELEVQRQLIVADQQAIQIKLTQAQVDLAADAAHVDALRQQLAAIQDINSAQGGVQAQNTVTALAAATAQYSKQAETVNTLNTEFGDTVTHLQTIGIQGRTAFQTLQNELAKTAFISQNSIGAMLEQVTTGILQGTQSIGNILSSVGQGLGVKFFSQLIAGKQQNLDVPLIGNISKLVFDNGGGLIGFLFGQGGAISATNFVSGFQGIFNGTGAGSIFTSLGQPASSGGGGLFGSLGNLFSNAGFNAAGSFVQSFGQALPIIGVSIGLGQIFAKILGGGQGATIGGFLGPLGAGLGALFDVFFAHTPTQGTQIRASVKDTLTSWKVSFAAEIDSGNYFFEDTKALAAKMFGGDFLAASKDVLTTKAGPEIAKQLQALGTFITADQAMKLGKSVEQTGTTFGNMLIANLGIDKIPAAIAETISKGNITFQALTDKLTSVFQAGKIGADFYKDAIMGAVGLFTTDLPAGIDIAKIAMDSFTKDGIFDLEVFKAKILDVSTAAKNIQDSLTKAITEGISGNLTTAQVEINFKTNLQQVIRDELIAKTIAEGIGDVFKGIDLTKPLDSATIDLLGTRVGVVYDNVKSVLGAAGALPDAFNKTTTAATSTGDAVESILKGVGLTASQIVDVRSAFANLKLPENLSGIATQDADAVKKAFDDALASAGLTADQITKVDGALHSAGLFAKDFAAGLKDAANASADLAAAAKDATAAADLKGGAFAADIRSAASTAISDGIKNGASATDIGASFTKGLENSIATSITNAVITGFTNAALTSSALGPALAKITDLENSYIAGKIDLSTFTKGIAGAFAAAKPEIEKLAAAIGVTGDELRKALGPLLGDDGTGAHQQGFINNPLNDLLGPLADKQKAVTDQTSQTADAAKAAADNTGAMVDALQAALKAAGGSAEEIAKVKDAMLAAGASGGNLTDALGAAAKAAGLSLPELAKMKDSLGLAGDAGNAVAKSLADALAKSGLLPPTLKDAGSEADGIRGAMEKALANITSSASQAQALATALQNAAIASATIHIPAAPAATGHAGGGLVGGSGTGDTVPAMLAPGEFVVNAKDAQKHLALLAQINAGMEVAHFATGGPVGTAPHNFIERALADPTADSHLVDSLKSMGFAAKTAATSVQDLAKQIDALAQARIAIGTTLAEQLGQIGALSAEAVAKVKYDAIKNQLQPLLDQFNAGTKLSLEDLAKAQTLTNQLRTTTVDRYTAEVASLQQIQKDWQTTTRTIQDAITSIVAKGPGSSGTEQLAFLQIQAAQLRAQIKTAAPADQPALVQSLATNLQNQVQTASTFLSTSDQRFANLRDDVVKELQGLQVVASHQVDTTAAAIADLRTATVTALRALAAQEDALAVAQIAILQKQLDAMTHPVSRTPPETVPNPHHPLGGMTSAASGFLGTLTQDQLFLAHAGELVAIAPVSKLQAVTAPAVSTAPPVIQYSPQISVRVDGGSDDPQDLADAVGRQVRKELDQHADDFFLKAWGGRGGKVVRQELTLRK